jgi:hypothetical protein
MTILTPKLAVGAVAALASLTAPVTLAPPASAAVMPLRSTFRACDHTPLHWVNAVGYARATANLSNTGSGTIVATVDMATAEPDTHYDIRVIQMPLASTNCGPGAPGVLVGGLQTNAVGAGTATVQGAAASGTTGAWVIVDRPAYNSQTPAEFYTSEYIAAI